MTIINKLDPLQEKLIKQKFSRLFQKNCDVYNSPKSTKQMANIGIATKIAKEYSPVSAYYLSERYQIIKKLSTIDFTAFFFSSKDTSYKDKKIFLLFKNPKSFLVSKASNIQSYIKFVLKKYCSVASSRKLLQLYNLQIKNKEITPTQDELKNAINEIATSKATLTNRLASFFDNEENKSEVKIAEQIKDEITKDTSRVINEHEASKIPIFTLIRSACKS